MRRNPYLFVIPSGRLTNGRSRWILHNFWLPRSSWWGVDCRISACLEMAAAKREREMAMAIECVSKEEAISKRDPNTDVKAGVPECVHQSSPLHSQDILASDERGRWDSSGGGDLASCHVTSGPRAGASRRSLSVLHLAGGDISSEK
ncbi:hypothetical protein BHE74_00026949 [Ensete ventricosum]|nr:hypothetical protein BHE74_00026949 [Ensete ventricosum]RZR76942.1 hypothetical protein BHM03_00001868 [Ensete ventricosum]